MSTINITNDNLDDTIKNNDMVVLDFWADWCGPCKMFGPIFERTSEKYPDITFGKVNTEEATEVAAAFGIKSIPTLAVFREQLLLFKNPGALPEPAFKELVEKIRGLDMDEVRKEIVEEDKVS